MNYLMRFALAALLLPCLPAIAADLEPAKAALRGGRFVEAYAALILDARAGDPEAQRLVGEMYFKGQGVPKSTEAAFQWNLAAANQGDALAQYSVGYLYENGLGVAASRMQAEEYYRKSAIQGFAPAQVKVGDAYQASQQLRLAASWYKKAADLGNDEGTRKFTEVSGKVIAQQREAEEEAREKATARAEKIQAEQSAQLAQAQADREAGLRNTLAGVHQTAADLRRQAAERSYSAERPRIDQEQKRRVSPQPASDEELARPSATRNGSTVASNKASGDSARVQAMREATPPVAGAPSTSANSATARADAQDGSCISWSTPIPLNKEVCFAQSMQEYACRKFHGKFGLEYVQKLILKDSLKDKSLCFHVDYTNLKPPVDQLLN